MKFLKSVAVLMLVALAACGPADVDQAANEAATTVGGALPSLPPGAEATAAAALNDPTTQAALATAEAALNDPTTQALLEQAGALVPSDLRLQADQPLVLDTTQQIAGVTNYKWTVAEVPAGAESVKGQVIEENSTGKLTIESADYQKYFPASGDYTINLDLTFEGGTTQTVPIPVTVP
ncbi:MAG TPA: hypothetical protein VGD58_13175 [Herpetosiphonaceae bacterium]